MEEDSDNTAEANRLYWESDQPVAEIAEQLDLSRRALYQAVEPLPAGEQCSNCGSELVFENRSARNAGTMVCIDCEANDEEYGQAPPSFVEETLDLDEDQAVRIGMAGIAGALVGALVTFALVPRR